MATSDAVSLLASLVTPDGRRWGERASERQWADARAVLEDRRRQSYITRPRGGAKTEDGGGMVVAALLTQLPRQSRSYGAAVDREQAQLLVDSVGGFADRTPGLSALRVDSWKVANTSTGATFEVLAADGSGAYGKRPHVVLVDEYSQWPATREARRLWEALYSSLGKVATSRLVVMTSAGDPTSPAGKLIERARLSPAWYVSEMAGPLSWVAPGDLAEQRAELSEAMFARLHENRWVAAEDRLVNPEDLAACVVLDGPLDPRPGVQYRIGLDLGVKHDSTVVAVCHSEPVGDARRVVLDRMLTYTGRKLRPVSLDAVEAAVASAAKTYNRATIIADPWQAVGMCQRLRTQGLTVEEFTFSGSSVGRLGSTLHLLLRDRLLALPDDARLLDELAHVRLVETAAGTLRLDHDAGRHDDAAVALALAATSLLSTPLSGPARTSGHLLRNARINPHANSRAPRIRAPHGTPVPPNDPRWDGARALGIDPQEFFR